VSAFYAVYGALCLVVAADLGRYRPLVRFLGAAFALTSAVFLGVDLAEGMPWWWTASEGPGGVVFGALLFVLARPAHEPCKQEKTPCTMKRNAEGEDKMPSQGAIAWGPTGKATVRDKLWLWGHDAGAHNDGWGLPRPSRIPPAEAAFYLGTPNLIM